MLSEKNNLIHHFRSMLRIRRVEEVLAERYPEGEMRCPMHLCIGQEAIAVGVCSALKESDAAFSNHRAHGHYLAKGGSLDRMIAEIYCRATGCCGGRGGSMHLIDLSAGFMGSTPIVGGTIPLAVGAALAAKMKGSNQIVVAFFGDGAFEEGVVHESLNFAALKNLPLIFVCENNGYSVYSNLEERQPKRPIAPIPKSHGWEIYSGDGNNVQTVFDISSEAVSRIHQDKGPQFLEFETYRWLEHCGPSEDDHLGYRPEQESQEWKEKCPIKQTRKYLLDEKLISESELVSMLEAIDNEIHTAFEFARASPAPAADTLFHFSKAEDIKCVPS
jgi:TPP-dependent pyruvate/acetoin dehydrogenase alpha subunit